MKNFMNIALLVLGMKMVEVMELAAFEFETDGLYPNGWLCHWFKVVVVSKISLTISLVT